MKKTFSIDLLLREEVEYIQKILAEDRSPEAKAIKESCRRALLPPGAPLGETGMSTHELHIKPVKHG